jgi:predicted nucleic acid-binding Zn ribbon protein
MIYSYLCKKCEHEFEVFNIPIAERERPLGEPCPSCGKKKCISQKIEFPAISHRGVKSVYQMAGNGFNDLKKRIAQKAGRRNTIKLK